MLKKVIWIVVGVCCGSVQAIAQNDKNAAYFCTANAAGGLSYNNSLKKWEGAVFKAEKKFIMRLKLLKVRVQKDFANRDETVSDYEVKITEEGQNYATPCLNGSNGEITVVNKYGFLVCDWSVSHFIFNVNNNRFLEGYLVGYVSGQDSNSDTLLYQAELVQKLNEQTKKEASRNREEQNAVSGDAKIHIVAFRHGDV